MAVIGFGEEEELMPPVLRPTSTFVKEGPAVLLVGMKYLSLFVHVFVASQKLR